MRKQQKGFTLIEIMIVVIILGMLATLVIQAVGDRPDQAPSCQNLAENQHHGGFTHDRTSRSLPHLPDQDRT